VRGRRRRGLEDSAGDGLGRHDPETFRIEEMMHALGEALLEISIGALRAGIRNASQQLCFEARGDGSGQYVYDVDAERLDLGTQRIG
jgi:hypothetical protein